MADLYWTLGEVRYGATWRAEEGVIEVRMSTVTPGFETFVVSADGTDATASGATYAWKLHKGTNRLAMRSRNKAGVEGPASVLEVTWGEK